MKLVLNDGADEISLVVVVKNRTNSTVLLTSVARAQLALNLDVVSPFWIREAESKHPVSDFPLT